MQNNLQNIYKYRFKKGLEGKNKVWRILCNSYFQKFINPQKDTVLDVAAGYGEFLNNINAKRKIAVDLNQDIKKYVKDDVEVIISDCKNIEKLPDHSVDKIFVSNFLEHLNNTDEIITVLKECHRLLKNSGYIMILQPNIYYLGEKYWFFIDHKVPITHRSLAEALELSGFRIKLLKKKFLPYSTKSHFPRNSLIIKTYLNDFSF